MNIKIFPTPSENLAPSLSLLHLACVHTHCHRKLKFISSHDVKVFRLLALNFFIMNFRTSTKEKKENVKNEKLRVKIKRKESQRVTVEFSKIKKESEKL
jgi:outer membrane PBP1 activator LpoA protein